MSCASIKLFMIRDVGSRNLALPVIVGILTLITASSLILILVLVESHGGSERSLALIISGGDLPTSIAEHLGDYEIRIVDGEDEIAIRSRIAVELFEHRINLRCGVR